VTFVAKLNESIVLKMLDFGSHRGGIPGEGFRSFLRFYPMENLNTLSPVGTRFLPNQLALIQQAADLKKVPRSVLIRLAATHYARQVLHGEA